MSIISVHNLTFAYPGSFDNIFESVSFDLDTDWRLGLIGRNGYGKTTFLRLLQGEYEYEGKITANVQFEYFPFSVPDPGRLTGEVVSQVCGNHEEWRLKRELSLLRLGEELLERPFSTLSNGERTKVLLSALFLKENGFLLIDEPTNHLDCASRELVAAYLRQKSGFILVSHDRAFLDACIDHVLSINRMNIDLQKGNFSSWQQNKQRQDEMEQKQNELLKKDIGRLSAAAQRTAGWSQEVERSKYGTENTGIKPDRGYVGHKAAKMMKRSKSIEARRQAAVEEKEGLLKNIEKAEVLKLFPRNEIPGTLFSGEGISLRYGELVVARDICFSLECGERLAVCGKNGCGKTTLLRLLCGETVEYDGAFYPNGRLTVSYLPQSADFLQGSLRNFSREEGLDESLFKAILRKLGFARTQFEKDMSDYSAGQKKKVLLAKSLSERAHVYVWDEPLNYVDLFSRMQIEELLLTFAPTLVFVEHDRAFCKRIATKTLTIGED